MKTVTFDAQLQVWRSNCAVYRAAMRKALAMVPVGDGTLLDIADAIGNSVPLMARIAWQDVIQFERLNSDVQMWGPVLIRQVAPGMSDVDPAIDGIFLLAQAIESGGAVEPARARLMSALGL